MKKQFLQSAKIILLAMIIGLGVNYLFAAAGPGGGATVGGWSGPGTTPPGGNTPAPINVSTIAQSKGGYVPSGALFDVSGLFTSDRLLVAGDATVGDLSSVANPSATYPSHVCVNANGTFELCAGGGGTGPQTLTQVYYLDNAGNPRTSGPCVACTATQFIPDAGVQVVTVSAWGAGGAGGSGADAVSNSSVNAAVREGSGTSGGVTSFIGTGGVNVTADGGSGGQGGTSKCRISGPCPEYIGGTAIVGRKGLGGSGGGSGPDGLDGEDAVSTQNLFGGSGGGGEAGEFVQQTIAIPSGGTFNVNVGKRGLPTVVWTSTTNQGTVSPCPSGGGSGSTGFLNKFIKVAYASPTGSVGGQGGTAVNSASHGNAGNGGDGGSTEWCGGFGASNSGESGQHGRVEVTWTQ